MIRWRLILICSCLPALTGCESEEKKPELVAGGRVVNAETLEPVDSAVVSMLAPGVLYEGIAQQVYTDEQGYFSFDKGSEGLMDNSLEISKAPYFHKSDPAPFRYEVSDFLLHPKAYIQINTEVENTEGKNWGLRVVLYEGEKRIGPLYSRDNEKSIFFPLKGSTTYRVEAYLFLDSTYPDSASFEINVPYRDTLRWVYRKQL